MLIILGSQEDSASGNILPSKAEMKRFMQTDLSDETQSK